MAGGLESGGNENISAPIEQDDIEERIAALQTQNEGLGAMRQEEGDAKKEDGNDLLRMIRDSGDIDMDEIHKIEEMFGVSWNAIKEEPTGIVPQRNDAGLEIADSEMGLIVQDIKNIPQDQQGSERYNNLMKDIKAVSLSRGGYYNIGSFFTSGEQVEGDIHFYPNSPDGQYGEEPIRVGENTTLQDIGTQLLQGLVQGGTFVEGGSGDGDLIQQIEEAYGVDWNTVKETA